jgi:uncharacterized protein (DUF1778 family)
MPRPPTRRLTVELPTELVELVRGAAEISRTTVDDFVEAVLRREIERWTDSFPRPAPTEGPDESP